MSESSRKATVRNLLKTRDFDGLWEWADSMRNPQRTVLSLAFDQNELIRWRAIEAIGKLAARQADLDIEKTRDLIRRLFWLMNDESGGLGWHSPEMIAEILVNVPALIYEFSPLLVTYLREEPFERGTHFAIYRIASVDRKPFQGNAAELCESLRDSDPAIRGFAALALGAIRAKSYRSAIEKLRGDRNEVRIYDFDAGMLDEMTVEQMAAAAVAEADSANGAA